jgi:hypothetical protein
MLVSPKTVDEISVGVASLAVGYMRDSQHFDKCGRIGHRAGNTSLTTLTVLRGKGLKLIDQCEDEEVFISVLDLDGYVCMSINNTCAMVYLALKFTPKAYRKEDGDKTTRICVPHCDDDITDTLEADLFLLARCPIVVITLADDECYLSLCAMLSDGSALGRSMFMCRIINVEGEYPHRLSADESVFSSSNPFVRRVGWEYASLCSEKLNPSALGKILVDIKVAISLCKGGDDRLIRCALQALQTLKAFVGGYRKSKDGLYLRYVSILDKIWKSTARAMDQRVETIDDLPEGYVMMDRVVFTPSRHVITPSVPMKTNRLLRRFSNNYRFLYVSFRDERFQRIYSPSIFQGRFLSILSEGFRIWDHYSFVACSGSQTREQNALFVLGNHSDVENIRCGLINDSSLVGFKYWARLGLYCTTDTETALIKWEQCKVVEDVAAVNGKLLTDGAGLVSSEMMSCICEKLGVPRASVIQIRFLGCKGVLMDYPGAFPEGKCIIFRKSMLKFTASASEENLGVAKAFIFSPLRLNRDMLTILFTISRQTSSEDNWLTTPYVIELQDEVLSNASQIFIDRNFAINALGEAMAGFDKTAFTSTALDILTEPRWRRLLELIYRNKVCSLRKKTHIPVKQGCLLVGVPDAFQVLGDGEVFIQIQRSPDDEPEIIIGPVAIYRNPINNMGDIRRVMAVDRPELRYLINCLVLPAREGIAVSLAFECSGGDNDGDEFSIIWDPKLVLPENRVYPPTDYDEIMREAKEAAPLVDPKTPEETIVRCMSNQVCWIYCIITFS